MEVGFYMGRKPKYSKELKVKVCKDYLDGEKSVNQLLQELNLKISDNPTIYDWVNRYRIHGETAFDVKKHNRSYTKGFKLRVVEEYLNGSETSRSLAAKYNISHRMVNQWVKKYNSNIEIRNYSPMSEVYMKDTLKTTLEERIEIVKYCIEHNKNYKYTCIKYDCNYAQLYRWVKKYEQLGKDGLIDKRGKRKKDEELTELEKAQKKIVQLEREKEEFRKRYELLKKAEEIERR